MYAFVSIGSEQCSILHKEIFRKFTEAVITVNWKMPPVLCHINRFQHDKPISIGSIHATLWKLIQCFPIGTLSAEPRDRPVTLDVDVHCLHLEETARGPTLPGRCSREYFYRTFRCIRTTGWTEFFSTSSSYHRRRSRNSVEKCLSLLQHPQIYPADYLPKVFPRMPSLIYFANWVSGRISEIGSPMSAQKMFILYSLSKDLCLLLAKSASTQ